MAVVNIREVYPGVSLGLWQMDESPEQLFDLYPHLLPYRSSLDDKYKNDGRKLEFLAIRALMYEMLRVNGASKGLLSHAGDFTHNGQGKPLFRGYHVSISHTKGYAALILSKKSEVAVDIEYMSDRVERIASKFLRKDERADSLDAKLVHWCAKETVFKLFSEENLLFEDMRVKPFDTMADWACDVENLKSGKTARVDFELAMDFVLTYSMWTK
ncbi:4'-phosphopantetheinyl transferase superfamily protein [Prevotella copri]|jgi:4'-phosphopantetheinyl transferase EntD|uniref:4'-phosphopantetheinyl transferase superfamily protein n=1 Tax=Segatella copri TaxID=165179 RepID=A0A6A7WEA0_9BACT|nr:MULTISPECIES: 4'-phosphopantetheinyl transferase family protein [Prevotellaceae]MBD9072749.1 4'-phosphopantetheinyl transferase superfamily protein [Prevotella sp.]CDC25675.1 putative siderophore biosynthesis regulatory protein [Prevotella sp. CAG:386]MBD9260640.1 4'-phosphopantetheinyl transferase superfamily protein [Prevotella sp.]MBP7918556.1 4'-phosphopantetheinyl transferase superfamily protein [Prevotella sp.]MBV3414672.1 4'-phosphopantetheinyl transferase superfamily protein [Segate